jgi:large subunit ribosomal protein L17
VRRADVVRKLFDELAGRYAARPGGYTRVVKLGQRRGDAAALAVVELVDRPGQDGGKGGGGRGGKPGGKSGGGKPGAAGAKASGGKKAGQGGGDAAPKRRRAAAG